MQNNLRIMLAALLVSLLLVLTVSCQKKTMAVESGSHSTAQDAGYGTGSIAPPRVGGQSQGG